MDLARTVLSMNAVQLLPTLRAFDAKDRALIAHAMIESLDDECKDPGYEQAWDEELIRRSEEIHSGKVVGIPAEQVFAEIEARYA